MSNPDQPSTPPLTRRQLREMRNTGSTQIVSSGEPQSEEPAPAAESPELAVETDSVETGSGESHAEPAVHPESTDGPDEASGSDGHPDAPGESTDAEVEERPVVPSSLPAADVDLGVARLTRRQAREQERIRTASVPVIAPDAPAPEDARSGETPRVEEQSTDESAAASEDGTADQTPLRTAEAALSQDAEAPVIVSPRLGSALLNGRVPDVELPPSFDHLLARESASTGAVMAPNALILSQTPSGASLTSPIAATGEILVTGTFALPEGLGSRGHALGTTDGKEADAVLIDGELPASSSPTPIAASAAISTVRSAEEIIRPPAPEKGSRLTLALAITAGALGLALVAVLIVTLVSGAWS